MIITMCTKSYLPWAKIFLESWKLTNDNREPIVINTMDVTKEEGEELKAIYPNLLLIDRPYDEQHVIDKWKVKQKDIDRCKKAIPKGFKKDCRFWMEYIVVDSRIKYLLDVMEMFPSRYWIHIDIDLLWRESFQPIIDKIKYGYDFAAVFGSKEWKHERKRKESEYIAGGLLITKGKPGIDFVKRWLYHIESVSPSGISGRSATNVWGQATLYRAYQEFQQYKWADIPHRWMKPICTSEMPAWWGHKKYNILTDDNLVHCPDRIAAMNKIYLPELERMRKHER